MRVFRIEKHPGDAFWREWHSGWRASVVRTEAEGGDTLFMWVLGWGPGLCMLEVRSWTAGQPHGEHGV